MPMAFQPPMKPIVPVPDFSAAAAPARKDASCSRNYTYDTFGISPT